VPHARAAVDYARRLRSVPVLGRGDAGVLEAARRHHGTVVTVDQALAARLRSEGLAVLGPRDRARLELRAGRRPEDVRPVRRARARPKG
jgi:rRNA-processing protein FCF1